MKKIILLLWIPLLFCLSCNINRNFISEQTQRNLTVEEKKPLIALGQLWGFLKYHHPTVAIGQYDWDMELIKIIPSILESENESQWKEILDNWLDSFPVVEENKKKTLPDMELKSIPDYGELFNTDYFYSKTIEKIKYILNNAGIPKNHYIKVDNYSGLTTITNEPAYKELLYPDLSYRLLALFKHWNIVNYFFPYRDLCDEKWSDVLGNMLAEFIYAKNEEEYIFACLKLVTKIDDSHGFFIPDNSVFSLREGLLRVPFETQFIEDKLVITMYTGEDAEVKQKIKIGDIVTAIDGEPVEDIVKRMLPYIPASNYAVKLRQIAPKILKGNSNTVTITILRDKKNFDMEISRYDMNKLDIPNYNNPQPKAEGYQILDNNIGYVLPSSCKTENRDSGIKKVLDGTKGIIIDMRCYPSDYISLEFLKQLNVEDSGFSLISMANISYPGYFFVINRQNKSIEERNQQNNYKNKIVVIVNEHTQSQAEDNVLGFQLASNVTVIGSTTAGANGKVTYFSLPGGIITYMTGLGVYYPDGSNLQREGVKIDEVLKPTIAGVKNNKDELLERAIEIIEEDYNRRNGNF